MDKMVIEKIIISSISDKEVCHYEINKNKVVFKKETQKTCHHCKAETNVFNVNYVFESKVSESMWNYIMHYNNALIMQINKQIMPKKKESFTIQLDLSNGQSIKRVVYDKIIGSMEIGLFSCVLFFPEGVEKPFWAK